MNSMRRHRLAGIGAALAAGVLTVTGCSAGDSATGGTATAASPALEPAYAAAKIRTLPIEEYVLSSAEYAKIMKARVRLDARCMSDFGFTAFASPGVPQADPRDSFTADRYGVEDSVQAAQYGYHPSPAVRAFAEAAPEPSLPADQELVLTGLAAERSDTTALKAAPRSLRGKAIPAGGCAGQSTRHLTGGSDELYPDLPQDINAQSYFKAKEDPRVRGAFAAWSACMKGKGFTYGDPMQANDDPRFATPTASPAEIATATADVACKSSTDLVGVWFRTEAEIQESLIGAQQAKLAPMRKTKQAALVNSSTVLAGN
ncbi:hypothetical protein ACIPQJ_18510 [Streptomyces sp. NPDC090082]|uniref:hypothetical protein n=1 Tax=unclassified Streptomyces TaxID=2593676 RepID=UPI00382EA380